MLINKLTEEKLMDMEIGEYAVFSLSGLPISMETFFLSGKEPDDRWFAVRVTRNDKTYNWAILNSCGAVTKSFGQEAAKAIALDHGVHAHEIH
mgnify:CR=1 FL=1